MTERGRELPARHQQPRSSHFQKYSLCVVPKQPAKQSGHQTARCNSQQYHTATPVPKGPSQQEVQCVNLLDTQCVRIATVTIAHRTPKLSSKSCQALERCILFGLCWTSQRWSTKAKSGQAQGRNAEPLVGGGSGSRQLLWDMAKSLANPTSRELVAHNFTILRELKTSHWHDSQIHIL